MVSMQENIEKKLQEALDPVYLEVVNDSRKHSGHSGDDGSGESHFAIVIRAKKLDGKSKIDCHRMIHAILKYELNHIHALSIKVQ